MEHEKNLNLLPYTWSQGPRVPGVPRGPVPGSQGPSVPGVPRGPVPGSQGPSVPGSQSPWGPKRPGPRAPGPRVPWGPIVRKKSSCPKSQDPVEKISNFEPLIILWHLINAITPTSILIFIAAFEFGFQKPIYIDLMQVL